jgi:hypothetical protein
VPLKKMLLVKEPFFLETFKANSKTLLLHLLSNFAETNATVLITTKSNIDAF